MQASTETVISTSINTEEEKQRRIEERREKKEERREDMIGLSPNCGESIPPTPALESHQGQITVVHIEDVDKEIPEEEAVCRICLVELSEGGKTLKIECSCKGDLTLTHEECAVKWFSTKGDNTCDVCGQKVLNLPAMTLFGVQGSVQSAYGRENYIQSSNLQSTSPCKDSLLVLLSSICYFIFLMLLLVHEMKSQALLLLVAVLSVSLGCAGLSCAEMLAIKEYKSIYMGLEYVLVVVIFFLTHSLLHLKLVFSFILSEVLGFGIAMAMNFLCLYIRAWRVQEAETWFNSNLV